MVRYVQLEAEPLKIAWLNDGSRIVASCINGRIRVIDADEVKVTQNLPGIEGWAYAIAIHPSDGSVVVGRQRWSASPGCYRETGSELKTITATSC